MPGWKQAIGRALDTLIEASIPGVSKAVKWNTPLYGVAPGRWFLGFHCFERYVKITLFRGAELTPLPPIASRQPHVRYGHLHEGDEPDPAPWTRWITQAASLPGAAL